MAIFVNGVDVTQSGHVRKKILLDTVILCYAHDRLCPSYPKAHLIIKASISGLIKTYVSYQNLVEFYSIMTGRKVKKPLAPNEAAELCTAYEKSMRIGKLLPNADAYRETFESAKGLSIMNGEVFDCLLAHTARGNVDTVWTENIKDFKKFDFLNVENPLEWRWEGS